MYNLHIILSCGKNPLSDQGSIFLFSQTEDSNNYLSSRIPRGILVGVHLGTAEGNVYVMLRRRQYAMSFCHVVPIREAMLGIGTAALGDV